MSKTVKSIIVVVMVAVLGIGAYFLITYLDKMHRKISTYEFESLIQPYEGEDNTENEGGDQILSITTAKEEKKMIVKEIGRASCRERV